MLLSEKKKRLPKWLSLEFLTLNHDSERNLSSSSCLPFLPSSSSFEVVSWIHLLRMTCSFLCDTKKLLRQAKKGVFLFQDTTENLLRILINFIWFPLVFLLFILSSTSDKEQSEIFSPSCPSFYAVSSFIEEHEETVKGEERRVGGNKDHHKTRQAMKDILLGRKCVVSKPPFVSCLSFCRHENEEKEEKEDVKEGKTTRILGRLYCPSDLMFPILCSIAFFIVLTPYLRWFSLPFTMCILIIFLPDFSVSLLSGIVCVFSLK